MPLLFTMMAWNIENYGAAKYTKATGRNELLDLIHLVITQNNIDVIGFSEIRSNLGATIGRKLTRRLNGGNGGVPWSYQASPQYVANRLEQYLFVWNTNVVTHYQAFQDTFANPGAVPPAPANVGFPRQKASDRPPYLGYFRSVAGPHDILFAVMHSPEPGFKLNARDAARNMALVNEFETQGETCVLMGDFNIKSVAVEAVANSRGAAAFGPLIALAPDPFVQVLVGGGNADVLTSLIASKSATVGMAAASYFNQPYDQIFFRTNGNNITHQNEGVDDLIAEGLNPNYLEASLVALWNRSTGNAVANFNQVEDAFIAYRDCISDHLPVVMEIHD